MFNAKKGETKDVPTGRAISIQQPFVEEILRGIKLYEYRSRPTKIRGRVYLYASLKIRKDGNWEKLVKDYSELPTGVIVGSVDIIDCIYFEKQKCYGYKLDSPKKYKKHLETENQPQPCFFFPFGPVRSPRKDPKLIKKRKPYKGKVKPNPELAAIIGDEAETRSILLEKVVKYIIKNKLSTNGNSEVIHADKKLKKLTKKSPFHINDLEYFIEKNSKR